MIYVVVFILLLIPVVKYDLMAKSGGENKWYYFNLIVLILLAGLRYRVGGDTLMYMSMYNEWPAFDELKYFDFETALYNPLWYVYTSIPKSISDEFWVFQMIQAVFVNCVFFSFFKKYSPSYYFSAILVYYVGYYCYFNMEIMREILCISILMLMTGWLEEKKYIPYFIGCAVAVAIHFSALIMLVLPLLYIFFKKPSWKWQLIIMLAVIVVLNVVNIVSIVISMLPLDEQFGMLIEKYLDIETNLNGMISQLILYLPVLGMIFIRERCPINYHDNFTPIIMGVVFAYAMSMGFAGFGRLVNYFIPFVIVYMVHTIYYFISNVDFKISQISHVVLSLSLCLLVFNYTFYYVRDKSDAYPGTQFYDRYSPYYSVLNPKIDNHREKYIENDMNVSFDF